MPFHACLTRQWTATYATFSSQGGVLFFGLGVSRVDEINYEHALLTDQTLTEFITAAVHCIRSVGIGERGRAYSGHFIPRAILKLFSVCLCFCV